MLIRVEVCVQEDDLIQKIMTSVKKQAKDNKYMIDICHVKDVLLMSL